MTQLHFLESEQIMLHGGDTIIILTNKLDNPRTLSSDEEIGEAYLK